MEFDYFTLLLLYLGLTLFFTINKVREEKRKELEDDLSSLSPHYTTRMGIYFAIIFYTLIEYLKIHLVMIPIFVIAGIIYAIFFY